MESFNSHSEDVKAAASYALGSLAVGNLEKFLPFLLKEISQNPKRQYQLLHTLKEVIIIIKKKDIFFFRLFNQFIYLFF